LRRTEIDLVPHLLGDQVIEPPSVAARWSPDRLA
jgi:hypothetical protein